MAVIAPARGSDSRPPSADLGTGTAPVGDGVSAWFRVGRDGRLWLLSLGPAGPVSHGERRS